MARVDSAKQVLVIMPVNTATLALLCELTAAERRICT